MKLPDMLEFIAVGFRADRFKTLMSSLGIIIGVMAIVVMLSVGEGLYSGVSSQFSTFNLDLIQVVPGSFHFGGNNQAKPESAGAGQVHRQGHQGPGERRGGQECCTTDFRPMW